MIRNIVGMFFLVAMMCLPARAGVEEIVCEGAYGGHLQGVCTDGTNIWWSFTVEIVKTDLSGKVLVSRKARSHQGDLCVKDGVVYVAANHGRFNTENLADSWVESYDAATLEPKKAWKLPEVPHGAGGMTWKDDRFFFGIYGAKDNPAGVLACSADLKTFHRHHGGGAVGMATINGKFYMARTTLDAEAKKAKRPCWRARLYAAKRP